MTVLSDSRQTREEPEVIDGHQLKSAGVGSAGYSRAGRRCPARRVRAGQREREALPAGAT